MKILVISDTHGYEGDVLRILYREKDIDFLIHCGDVEGGQWKIQEMAGCPCYFVKGNNDYFSDLPNDVVVRIGKYQALVTHGHLYGISMGRMRLETEARKRGAQIVLYGHTHCPYFEEKDGLTFANPGSLTYPRQAGRQGSYMVLDVDADGEVKYNQKFLTV